MIPADTLGVLYLLTEDGTGITVKIKGDKIKVQAAVGSVAM